MSQIFIIDKDKIFVNSYFQDKIDKLLKEEPKAITNLIEIADLFNIAATWEHYEIHSRLKKIIREKYPKDMKKVEYEFKNIGIPRTTYGRFTGFDSDLFNRNDNIDKFYLSKIKDYLFINDLELKEKKEFYLASVDILEIEKVVKSNNEYLYIIP